MPARFLASFWLLGALFAAASNAGAEPPGAPRVIETRPLKLFGDGAARPEAPPPAARAITTPPLRLVGDGSAPARETPPAASITIEARPLKLIGAKP